MNKDKFAQAVLDAETTLYRVAKSILLNDCDCEDAVSEAVLKAYQKLNTLREERYFKTWLTRILINECYRMQRDRSRLIPLEDYASTEPAANGESYSDLYRAITLLKPQVRIVIVLHYIEGYGVDEVARILKIPSGTVKSRLHNGRNILKEELKDE